MNPDNDWYGHKLALAHYCGRKCAPPIFGYLPHGWGVNLPSSSRRFSSAPLLVWNSRHLEEARSHGIENAVCIGAPFSYLLTTLWPSGDYPEGRGTFVMPDHSAELNRVTFDSRAFAQDVMSTAPGPYTASVFYQDLGSPQVAVYEELGWRIVSFGRRSNPVFLTRLAIEVARHGRVVSNSMATGLLYSGLMRRPIRVLGAHAPASTRGEDPWNMKSTATRWPPLHDEGLDSDEARALAEFELGWTNMQPPTELERTLGWSKTSRRLAARAIQLAVDLKLGKGARDGIVK